MFSFDTESLPRRGACRERSSDKGVSKALPGDQLHLMLDLSFCSMLDSKLWLKFAQLTAHIDLARPYVTFKDQDGMLRELLDILSTA